MVGYSMKKVVVISIVITFTLYGSIINLGARNLLVNHLPIVTTNYTKEQFIKIPVVESMTETTTKGKKVVRKRSVTLAIGILSKLSAISRRNSIRLTWFRVCRKNSDEVVCRFFTDKYTSSTSDYKAYVDEQQSNSDLEYMPYEGGYNFALRLLWMFRWFTENYKYDFFLRIDDDYFLCLDRLLKELPYRPKKGMYWGWVHCNEGTVRVDEGFMILSQDIIVEALEKEKTTLLCHPFGDQAVALWIADSKLDITYFADNDRVIHEVTSYQGRKYLIPNICEEYIGLHGTYPSYMSKYWRLDSEYTEKFLNIQYRIPLIENISKLCPYSVHFDYKAFKGIYQETPQLCKLNPVFRKSSDSYISREKRKIII